MPDYNTLLRIMKQASTEAVEAANPVHICYGKVISTRPLQINVEQKMILGESQLVLSRNVSDFTTQLTGENTKAYYNTGTEENPVFVEVDHKHAIGRIRITIHNGLAAGDEVLLIRMQGGQKYIVLDRMGGL